MKRICDLESDIESDINDSLPTLVDVVDSDVAVAEIAAKACKKLKDLDVLQILCYNEHLGGPTYQGLHHNVQAIVRYHLGIAMMNFAWKHMAATKKEYEELKEELGDEGYLVTFHPEPNGYVVTKGDALDVPMNPVTKTILKTEYEAWKWLQLYGEV